MPPLSNETLLKERPDLLALAVKLFMLSHTSKHSDIVELRLGIDPGQSAVLAGRELTMDLQDGAVVLKLTEASVVPVAVTLEKVEISKGREEYRWKVDDGKSVTLLSPQMKPVEVDGWVKQNMSRAADVQFKRVSALDVEAEAEVIAPEVKK